MQQQPRMVRDYHDWRASRQPPGATLCSAACLHSLRVTLRQSVYLAAALYRATDLGS